MDKRLFLYIGKHISGFGNRALLKINEDYQQDISLSQLQLTKYIQPKYYDTVMHQLTIALREEKEWQEKMQRDHFFTYDDSCYPDLLKEIYNPPVLLFYKGDLSLLKGHHLSIIGSRKACDYSLDLLDELLKELVKYYIIVSGLAYGIDARSHQRTIYHHGKTIAVIGSGLDYYYPKEHYALQNKIAKEHLLLSEYPAATQPKPYYFPERNRIIAGLSEGCVVIQAAKKSGTAITAMQALEAGREVFALPSQANDLRFLGCHRLIQDGAKLITCAEDIVSELLHWRY